MACNCGKPEGTCGCKKDCHASPAVLQINNPADYATFHKVDVPVAFGDDTEYPALNGKYKNVILHYEKNDAVYLYSSDCIPTKLKDGINDIVTKDQLDEAIENVTRDINAKYNYIIGELSKRTEYVEIYFKDGYLKDKNDKILTYQEVQDMVIDPSKYVVCIWYELCLVPVFWLGDAVEFTETHIIENEPYINRVIINAQDQIRFEEMHLQKGE